MRVVFVAFLFVVYLFFFFPKTNQYWMRHATAAAESHNGAGAKGICDEASGVGWVKETAVARGTKPTVSALLWFLPGIFATASKLDLRCWFSAQLPLKPPCRSTFLQSRLESLNWWLSKGAHCRKEARKTCFANSSNSFYPRQRVLLGTFLVVWVKSH